MADDDYLDQSGFPNVYALTGVGQGLTPTGGSPALSPLQQALFSAAAGLLTPAPGGYGRIGPALGQGFSSGLGAYEQAVELQRKQAEHLAELQIEIAKAHQAALIARRKQDITLRGQDLTQAEKEAEEKRLTRGQAITEAHYGAEEKHWGAEERTQAGQAETARQRQSFEQDKFFWGKQPYDPSQGEPFVALQGDPPELKHAVKRLNRIALGKDPDHPQAMTLDEVKENQKGLKDLRRTYYTGKYKPVDPAKKEEAEMYKRFGLDDDQSKADAWGGQPSSEPAPKTPVSKTKPTTGLYMDDEEALRQKRALEGR